MTAESTLRKGQEISLKCNTGEVVRGTITTIDVYEIDRPVVLEDGTYSYTHTGDYIPGTGELFTVVIHPTRYNINYGGNDLWPYKARLGRQFYRRALLNAMEATG